MSKYLKLFETTSEYQTYISGGGVVLPNVSVAKDDLIKVYYNPYVVKETKLVVYYDIQDTSSPTTICTNYDNSIKSIEIDGTLLDSVVTTYQFNSVGEHVIKYEFNNPTTVGNSAPPFYNVTTIKRVVIADTFTSIGNSAFQQCTKLTSITIPDSVTSIGNYAFNGCESLTSITIPDSVTSIGNSAFQNCKGLTSINIPSGVISISQAAFQYCSNLTSVTIPDSVTSIGVDAFIGCTGLTSIVVDSANTVYDSRDNCNAIINKSTNELIAGCKNTIIPNSVTSIGQFAFNRCSSLTSITIPNSVTSIGNYAFYNCSSLTSITCNATTAPAIQNGTFRDVKTGGTLTVPTGSTGYDTWMSRLSNWTKVEQ